MPSIAISPIISNTFPPFDPKSLGSALVGYWRADQGITLVAAPTPNLVDGNMEAVGVTAWSVYNVIISKETGTRTGGTGTKVLRLVNTADDHVGAAFQIGIHVPIGNSYRIRGWARSVDGAGIPYGDYGGGNTWWEGTTSTEWQYFDVVNTPQYTTDGLALRNKGPINSIVEFDDITVTRADNGGFIYDGNCEADGYAVWKVGNNAALSKATTNPHGGTKCLRIAFNGTANPYASQNALTIGQTYRIVGYARSDGTSFPRISLDGQSGVFAGTTSTDWQLIDITVTPASGAAIYFTSILPAAGYVEFDDITVTCLNVSAWADQSGNGKHLTQPTEAATPALVDGVVKFASTVDWIRNTSAITVAHIFAAAKNNGVVTFLDYNSLVSGASEYQAWLIGDKDYINFYSQQDITIPVTLKHYVDGVETHEAGVGSWHLYEATAQTETWTSGVQLSRDRNQNLDSRAWNGDVFAVAIVNRTMNAGEVAAMRTFLKAEAAKSGVVIP